MIRKRSKKRAAQERQYKVNRELYLYEHPVCEACDNWPASEIHHKKGRTGNLLTDTKYFLAVCPECHRYIEDNPLEAKENGWSLSRLETEKGVI